MIKTPNYTQIPNEYFDKIMQTLSGTENIIFLAIMRKTFGWQKVRDKISYTQIEKVTGIGSYTTIKKGLSALEEKGLIKSERAGKFITYEVNITETVEVKTDNDYRNCSDTITETVAIVPKTTTETVDTKESNIKKLSKEIYTEIEDAYIKNYEELYSKKPVILYPVIRKKIKTLIDNGITKEQIILAIEVARNDAWIKSTGFESNTILSEKILPRLINASIQNSSLQEKKTIARPPCPRCGGEIIGGICSKCRCLVDENGKELK